MKIYYDDDCPLCRKYVLYQRLKSQSLDLELIDLRQSASDVLSLQRLGYDLDQGMVVENEGQYYFGSEALSYLAKNFRGMDALLQRGWLADLLYPIMKLFRNTMLSVLGRTSLSGDLGPGIIILAQIFGVFAYLHFLVYAFQFGHVLYPTTFVVGVLGGALFLKPDAKWVFVLLFVFMFLDALLQAPTLSNHTILKNFFLGAVVFCASYSVVRAVSWYEFWAAILPVARWLLLIMYFFGVFHKVNSDFLNPVSSCAAELWKAMPGPLADINSQALSYVLPYGTLVIEVSIFLLLVSSRFRVLGVVLGSAFHILLAFSGYAFYSAFSMLTVFLHFCFFSIKELNILVESKAHMAWREMQGKKIGFFVGVVFLGCIAVLSWLREYSLVAVPVLFFVLFLLVLVWQMRDLLVRCENFLFVSKLRLLNFIPVLFFLNCISPYFGLKTAQAMNMFANLRLEGGVSNHYFMPAPSGYLSDIVEVKSARSSKELSYVAAHGLHMVYYDLLDALDRDHGATVTFLRSGVEKNDMNYLSLSDDISIILHPRYFRAWFHFNLVDVNLPKTCALDR